MVSEKTVLVEILKCRHRIPTRCIRDEIKPVRYIIRENRSKSEYF